MKKWIKKISLAYAGIAVLGGVTMIISSINKQETVSHDQQANYIFSGGAAENRTYYLKFTFKETNNLYSEIKNAYPSTALKAVALFDFLTVEWTYHSVLKNNLDSYNDSESFNLLFADINPYTWKRAFKINDFEAQLKTGINNKFPLSMTLYIDYKFLAHNDYGVDYTI